MGSPSGCGCICHIPGSRVELVDGEPCCYDMESGPRRPTEVPLMPTDRPPRVEACSPNVYEGKSGMID